MSVTSVDKDLDHLTLTLIADFAALPAAARLIARRGSSPRTGQARRYRSHRPCAPILIPAVCPRTSPPPFAAGRPYRVSTPSGSTTSASSSASARDSLPSRALILLRAFASNHCGAALSALDRERDNLITEAQQQADEILKTAHEQAEMLLDQQGLMAEAQARSNQYLEEAMQAAQRAAQQGGEDQHQGRGGGALHAIVGDLEKHAR